MIIDEPKVVVKTAEVTDLSSFTTLRLEYLPAVIPRPVVTETVTEAATVVATLPELITPPEMHVPYAVHQELIYHWLKYGPRDSHVTVAQDPPPMLLPDDPVVTPLFGREPPRRIGYYDDGVRRRLVLRE